MMMYLARRGAEHPGVEFDAVTAVAAKVKASRLLEGGAFPGQRIVLIELADCDAPPVRVFEKVVGTRRWRELGD